MQRYSHARLGNTYAVPVLSCSDVSSSYTTYLLVTMYVYVGEAIETKSRPLPADRVGTTKYNDAWHHSSILALMRRDWADVQNGRAEGAL